MLKGKSSTRTVWLAASCCVFLVLFPCVSRAQSTADKAMVTDSDWGNVKEISPGEETQWKFKAETLAADGFIPRIVELPASSSRNEFIQDLVVSVAARRAVILYSQKGAMRLVVVGLENGEVLADQKLTGAFRLFDIHPDGNQLLLGRNADTARSVLETWVLSDNVASSVSAWRPFSRDVLKRVVAAQFIAGNQVLAQSENDHLATFDNESRNALFHIQLPRGSFPAVSDDNKNLAICVKEKLSIVNLTSGAVAATLPLPGMKGTVRCVFSPTSQQLAVSRSESVPRDCRTMVIETAAGKILLDNRPFKAQETEKIVFPADGFLLTNNSNLIDVATETNVWRFEGATLVKRSGRHVFYVADNALVPMILPHEEASQALASIKSDNDVGVWRKGGKVHLNVDGVPESFRGQITDLLTKNIAQAGLTLSEDAPVTLFAEIQGPKQDRLSLPLVGTHDVTRYQSILSLKQDSHLLWRNVLPNIPERLGSAGRQSYAEYLKQLSSGPNLRLFQYPDFPYRLQRVTDTAQLPTREGLVLPLQFLGQSKLTAKGIAAP